MNRYTRKYKEEFGIEEKPLSELSDSDFAAILQDGTKLFPIDTKERAQVSLDKLVQNLDPIQYKNALQKIQMRYPGLQPKEKSQSNEE